MQNIEAKPPDEPSIFADTHLTHPGVLFEPSPPDIVL